MNNRQTSFRNKVLAVLGTVLAAGAIAPSLQQSTAPNRAAQRNAPTTLTRAAPGSERRALPPPTPQSGGQVLGMIGGMGDGDPYAMTSRAGLSPKDWGMSKACVQLVRKNRGIARGISAQRL